MKEEIKKQANELTDEEAQGAAGGWGYSDGLIPATMTCSNCNSVYESLTEDETVLVCPKCGYTSNGW